MNTLLLWIKNPFNKNKIAIIALSFLWITSVIPVFGTDEEAIRHTIQETGELAWNLLLFTVFIGLFSKIFTRNRIIITLLSFRKYTGIFAFCIACTHFILFLIGAPSVATGLGYISGNYFLTFGVIALLGMLFPFVTSTLWAIKTLGPKAWKNIQRMTHIAFLFTVLHIAFIHYAKTGTIEWEAFTPLLMYFLGYGYVFWKAKNKIQKG